MSRRASYLLEKVEVESLVLVNISVTAVLDEKATFYVVWVYSRKVWL